MAISARTLEEGETHAHALTHADGRPLAGSLAAFFSVLTAYLAWRYRAPPRDWPGRLHDVVVARLRQDVATLGDDRYMADDLTAAAQLIGSGALVTATATPMPQLAV